MSGIKQGWVGDSAGLTVLVGNLHAVSFQSGITNPEFACYGFFRTYLSAWGSTNRAAALFFDAAAWSVFYADFFELRGWLFYCAEVEAVVGKEPPKPELLCKNVWMRVSPFGLLRRPVSIPAEAWFKIMLVILLTKR